MKLGIRRATVAKEMRTLKAILNNAVQWKHLLSNPIDNLPDVINSSIRLTPYHYCIPATIDRNLGFFRVIRIAVD